MLPGSAAAAPAISLPVPMYRQIYSLDCEAAALQMALRFEGVAVSQDRILGVFGSDQRRSYYDSAGRLRWGNAYKTFVGSVNGSEIDRTGYGTYWPVIQRTALALGGRVDWAGTGFGTTRLYAALQGGHPVQVYLPYDYSRPARHDYLSFDGQWIPYAGPVEHSVLLTGISDSSLLVNDPARGRYWVAKSTLVPAWGVYGQMAVEFGEPLGAPGWAGADGDGRLETFVRDGKGALWHRWQIAPAGSWAAAAELGGDLTGPASATSNRDGRIEAFARGSDGALWHAFQITSGGGWRGPWSLGGALGGDPVAVNNLDGRIEVFWIGVDGAVWHSFQVTPGGGWKGPWQLGGTGLTGRTGAARNVDGRLEVFALDAAGRLWHIWQKSAGGGWSQPGVLATGAAGTPVAAQDSGGAIEVVLRGTDGALWRDGQTSPGGGWSGMVRLGGAVAGDPALAANFDGRLEAFFRGTDGALWHAFQLSSGWVQPQLMGGSPGGDPAARVNRNGWLEVFYIGTDGSLWHRWQTSPGGGWSGPASLGGSWAS